MNITRNNYELYAVDFIEGELSPSEVAEFMVFLAENPDIADEIEIVRDTSLNMPKDNVAVDFSFLKKDLNASKIDKNNFEEYCIAFHENDLSDGSKKKLFNFIETNPLFKQKFELYGKLKLIPDRNILYPKKRLLKKENARLLLKRRRLAVAMLLAASFLALFILKIPRNTNKTSLKVSTTTYQVSNRENSFEENDIEKELEPLKKEKTENKISKKLRNDSKPKSIEPVMDTLKPERNEMMRLARLEIGKIEPSLPNEFIKVGPDYLNQPAKKSQLLPAINKENNKNILARVTEIRFSDVVRTGIKGLNQLTETDIKYETKTDNEGRVTEYALSTENFNIRRKLRN